MRFRNQVAVVIVKAGLFLLSDEASWVTGQILAVDGGQIVRV